MAVPGWGNGLMEEDDNEDKNALFEEEGLEELDAHTPPHLRAIADASQRGNLDALRLALDNLVGSIDDAVEDGDTALHLACLYGNLSCVELLLERGANLEAKDEDGAIPLHDACAGASSSCSKIVAGIWSFAYQVTYQIPSDLPEADTEARRLLDAASAVENTRR